MVAGTDEAGSEQIEASGADAAIAIGKARIDALVGAAGRVASTVLMAHLVGRGLRRAHAAETHADSDPAHGIVGAGEQTQARHACFARASRQR